MCHNVPRSRKLYRGSAGQEAHFLQSHLEPAAGHEHQGRPEFSVNADTGIKLAISMP